MGVDADLDPVAERLDDRGGRLGDEARQAAAVGVAEGDVLGAGLGGGAHAFERVAGVVAVAVEEVLGVEDRPLALRRRQKAIESAIIARFSSRETRITFSTWRPEALADQADDRGEGADQDRQRLVLGGGAVAAPGHAEGGDRRVRELDLGEALEELRLLRVGAREAGLDEVDAEPVEGLDHLQFLADGERHAVAAHAVPQGCVVELDLFHLMPFESRDRGGLEAGSRR